MVQNSQLLDSAPACAPCINTPATLTLLPLLALLSEIYPLEAGDRVKMVLAKTLKLDGSDDVHTFNQSYEASLADQYEYVMHGKVFKVNQIANSENV